MQSFVLNPTSIKPFILLAILIKWLHAAGIKRLELLRLLGAMMLLSKYIGCSKEIVLIVLCFFSASLFCANDMSTSICPSVFEDDAREASYENTSYYEPVTDSLPDSLMKKCLRSMPPLLQGIHAYYKSGDMNDREMRIQSFHKFLLVGPRNLSLVAQAIAQDLDFEVGSCDAMQVRGDSWGETAENLRAFFRELRSKRGRAMVILKNLDRLFQGNSYWDFLFSGEMDSFERTNSDIIFAIPVGRANGFSMHFKSRFRTQYVYMPQFNTQISLLAGGIKGDENDASEELDVVESANAGAEDPEDHEDEDVKAEFKAIISKGISYRDLESIADAVAMFAYNHGLRKEGQLHSTARDNDLALLQVIDRENVLDYYAEER